MQGKILFYLGLLIGVIYALFKCLSNTSPKTVATWKVVLVEDCKRGVGELKSPVAAGFSAFSVMLLAAGITVVLELLTTHWYQFLAYMLAILLLFLIAVIKAKNGKEKVSGFMSNVLMILLGIVAYEQAKRVIPSFVGCGWYMDDPDISKYMADNMECTISYTSSFVIFCAVLGMLIIYHRVMRPPQAE